MRLFFLMMAGFFLPLAGYAHNGKVSYAYPVDSIILDGNLSDWPASIPRYWIGNSTGFDIDDDFSGQFMVGYNVLEGALYIAVEILDDSNVTGSSEGNVWGRRQDRQLLYIDPEHSQNKGSGLVMLFGSQTGVDLWKPENGWDPYNSEFTTDNVQLQIQRIDNRTIYEWKINLGSDIETNRSLGLDIEFEDVDLDSPGMLTHKWGPGDLKNRVPSRLGDVVLVESGAKIGKASGVIAWAEPNEEPLPEKVKIVSVDDDSFWIRADVTSAGNYSADIPVGSYRVQSAYKTTNPYGFQNSKRLDEQRSVILVVREERTSIADTLTIGLYDKPDFLIPATGILYDYEPSRAEQINTFVEAFRDYYNVPGLRLALIREGEIVYDKSFGTMNTITGEPVTESTMFETASISKSLFAYAVHRLADKGVIDLDRPLFEYLPFENIAGDERSRLITARMVLSHQTGLPNWAWGGPFGWQNGGDFELLFTPGEGYEYSGEGYEYLKRVLEAITGDDIATIMDEQVFQVMGMEESALSRTPEVVNRVSIGHQSDEPTFWNIESTPWIAGSMYSTTTDLAKFIIGMMNHTGLSEESFQSLVTPVVENNHPYEHSFGGYQTYHSMGFEIEETPYGRFVHHGGNNGDFQGRMAMLPDQGLGFVLMTNNNSGFQLDLALQELLFTGRLSSQQ